jgi:hypothetical protein
MEATGERKHPYVLAAFAPALDRDERLTAEEALPANTLFKYRTAARRHLVKAEIMK